MKNQKEIIKNEEMKNQEELKNNNKKEEIKMNFLESIKDEKIKSENFKSLFDKIKSESKKEISFIDSLELKFNKKSLKEIIEKNKFELFMIHEISRKSYHLYLYDFDSNKEYYIMNNDSIMKNKIYSIKLSQLMNEEIKIHYIKNDRKNQSSEIIKFDNKDYLEKLKKYSSI